MDFFPDLRNGEGERAGSKTECFVQDNDFAIVAAFLLDHVETCDSKIHTALTHTNDNIAGALKDDPQLRQSGNLCLILTRVRFEHREAAGSQEHQGAFLKASF